MPDLADLKLLLVSQTPIVVIESKEEKRVTKMVADLCDDLELPLYRWTVTNGLQRSGPGFSAQKFNSDPQAVLGHIHNSATPGIYLLLDFHPYLEDPVSRRMIREIAHRAAKNRAHLIFLSPSLEIPVELSAYTAKLQLSLPNEKRILEIIRETAVEYTRKNPGKKVIADKRAVHLLARNLQGLSASDVSRLARKAIFNDGAITKSDIKNVMESKYRLINQNGVLSFEYETASFADVGGFKRLKEWLTIRHKVFHGQGSRYSLEAPKGVLLLGVQGCGKSLAAKAVAGVWNVPLLRLDFGALYDKFIGETEKNLRESLSTAEVMSPCVMWIDEVEKGLAGGSGDDGVSRRVLGTLLTWMAERNKAVFLVATANDIESLPPELMRKGRFDEIFFVDLPDLEARTMIFSIQLQRRKLSPARFDLPKLARLSEGFSGSEIEQAVVSSLYSALAADLEVDDQIIATELQKTKPLSVVMAEKVQALRQWASTRTVPAN